MISLSYINIGSEALAAQPLFPASLLSTHPHTPLALSEKNNMNYNLLENGTTITRIDVSFGILHTLPILPLQLEILVADHNHELEELPSLPQTLRVLSICMTGVQSLTRLPPTLEELYVSDNPGILLPDELPSHLQIFVANCCELEDLPPTLPPCLRTLSVDGNYLEILPELPLTLQTIIASNNQLLQVSQTLDLSELCELSVLHVHNNVLRRLPELPPKLVELNCSENNLKRLPRLPESLRSFVYFGNPLDYEILHKRIPPQEYINRLERFSRFMAQEKICTNVWAWTERTRWMDGGGGGGGAGAGGREATADGGKDSTWNTPSKVVSFSSFSSMSSFCSISSSHSIDYLFTATISPASPCHSDEEFVFL